jgi:hypothetical protein
MLIMLRSRSRRSPLDERSHQIRPWEWKKMALELQSLDDRSDREEREMVSR